MKLKKFIKDRKSELDMFEKNMNSQFKDAKRTKEGWMEWFLDWDEWKTDMHNLVWTDDPEGGLDR